MRNLQKQEELFQITGHKYYKGEIVATLNELCEKGYGDEEVTTQHRKAMDAIIRALSTTGIKVTYPNGEEDAEESSLITFFKFRNSKNKSVIYHITLNHLFCEKMRGYLELPQDCMKRLKAAAKKVTDPHTNLFLLLARQDKRKPFIRHIKTLIEELGLEESYRNDRGRTEKQLLSCIETMTKMGMLKPDTPYETETAVIRRKERIIKVTFHLNPNFVRKRKTDED